MVVKGLVTLSKAAFRKTGTVTSSRVKLLTALAFQLLSRFY